MTPGRYVRPRPPAAARAVARPADRAASATRRSSTARSSCSTTRSARGTAIGPRSSPTRDAELRRARGEGRRHRRVLVEDLGLVPGNRVLLRGRTLPMLMACWLAVAKAGGIVVATMPLLRARSSQEIIAHASIGAALCDDRLLDELEAAPATGSCGSRDGRGAGAAAQAGAASRPTTRRRRRGADRLHLAARPAGRRARCTSTATCSRCATRSSRHDRCARAATTSSSARRRSRSRSASAASCCSRCASARRPSLLEQARARQAARRDRAPRRDDLLHRADRLPAHARRSASMAGSRACAAASRRARRCRAPCGRPGTGPRASRSSTASARPR